MEITRTLLHSSCSKLPFQTPFLHFQSQVVASSFSSRRDITKTSSIPIISRTHFRKPIAASCSASDGSNSSVGSATKVSVADPSVALKKKAMDISPELKGTSIFLVGKHYLMLCIFGKLLANVLRYYYFDSDSLVEEAAGGESAAKSLRETDKNGFHESETEVLKQLSSMGRLVVCAGDGAVQRSTNLALLRYGISIWIDIPVDLVARGVIEDQSRFLHSTYLLQHLIQRSTLPPQNYNLYNLLLCPQKEKLACKLSYDDFGDVTTEDMALEVLKEIEKLTRVKKMMEAAARPF
ncbi:putative inactive shikimate kinase like 1 chloroplastic isoform X2 [Prunus yedoensis var. nudiflora]|uniref:Putative inactive shikimate kinase like 1 chloroplastic isoform X2 n=1 Tax=Prunus yedoensis var. nudiflora TaxID=2094558 RepID=A0A314YYJ9_PRUYE|nr:putative inactive shikimate kinase like 1 chloroplastic isoform X2 [Prunus yedoensis var. nudiflora]